MDIPNQKIECIVIENKKPKAEIGNACAKFGIIAAIFIICLNFIELVYVKRGYYLTENVTSIGTGAAVIIGIAAGLISLTIGLTGKRKSIIQLALAGLLLNGVLTAAGFVKNPLSGELQAESKTEILSSGRKIITEDWVAQEREPQQGEPIELSDEDFDKTVNSSNKIVLVDFWASWCKPCRTMAPVIKGLAAQYKGQAKVCKVNVDEAPKTSAKFSIKYLPTIILFKNGHEYERWTGYTSSSDISSAIARRMNE